MTGKRPVSARGLCRSPVIHLLLIVIAGCVAYVGTLHFPFVFDDRTSIVENLSIRDMGDFLAGAWHDQPRRVFGYLTFALNYRFGGLDVTGYHLTNLVIHLLAASLVYWLCLLTFRTPGAGKSRLASAASLVALFAALFFVLHPVQTQAVTYVTQRLASLAGLFFLLAMVLWVRAVQGEEPGSRSGARYCYAGAAGLAALAAILTKETAATLPLAAFLYGRLFFPASPRAMLRRLAPLIVGIMVPLVAWLATALPGKSSGDLLALARGGAEVGRLDYLLTQPPVIVTYLRLILLPVWQNIDHDFPVFHSLSLPVLGSLLVLLALVAIAHGGAGIASRGGDQGWRVIAFGIGWFFIALLVESSIIPIDDVLVEHRLYLPLAGFSLAAATTAGYLVASMGSARGVALGLLLFLVLGTLTWRRNQLWSSPVELWRDAVTKSPGKARPHYNLGTSLNDAGVPAAALASLERAVALQPEHADAWHNLGVAHAALGEFAAAIAAYRSALALDSQMWRAQSGLGVALMNIGELEEAIAAYREAVRLAPDSAQARNNLGAACGIMGKRGEAVVHLEEAVRLAPENRLFRENLEKAQGLPGS